MNFEGFVVLPYGRVVIQLSEVVNFHWAGVADGAHEMPVGYVNFKNGTHLALECGNAWAFYESFMASTAMLIEEDDDYERHFVAFKKVEQEQKEKHEKELEDQKKKQAEKVEKKS